MQLLRFRNVAAFALLNLSGSDAVSLHRAKSEDAEQSGKHAALVASQNPFENVWQSVAGIMGENPLDTLKKEAKDMFDKGKARAEKPIMGSISRFRIMMCNGRPNLLTHEACMKFMTEKCIEKSTGEGDCQDYENYLVEQCKDGSHVACDHAHQMGLDVGEQKEEKKKDEEQKEEEEEQQQQNNHTTNITEENAPNASIPANQTAPVGNGTNASEPVAIVLNASAEAGPTGIDKKLRDLPEHGFNEYGNVSVLHSNNTGTQDWLDERPRPQVETDDEATYRVCKGQKETSEWCKLFIRHYEGSGAHSSSQLLAAPSLVLSLVMLALSSVRVLGA